MANTSISSLAVAATALLAVAVHPARVAAFAGTFSLRARTAAAVPRKPLHATLFAEAPVAHPPPPPVGPSNSARDAAENDTESTFSSFPTEARRRSAVPDIDSEILSGGKITKASPPREDLATKPIPSNSRKSSSSDKSSTMPGFVRDDAVDVRIAHKEMKRASPPARRRATVAGRRGSPSSSLSSSVAPSSYKENARSRRRSANGEALYKKSASVPDSLVDYANMIHAIDRVTPRQEVELGTLTQEAVRLHEIEKGLRDKHGRDPTDDEWCAASGKINAEALREAIESGAEAKNRLVESNLRMVQSVVNIYLRNGLGGEVNAGDLMQDGTMALIRAAEKFEPERGFRFSTYAMYWIRSAVKRSQTIQSRIVRVPQRVHETHRKARVEEGRLRSELGRDPSDAEVSAAVGITVVKLEQCRRAMRRASYSLDAPLDNPFKPGENAGSRGGGGSGRTRTVRRGRSDGHDVAASEPSDGWGPGTKRALVREDLIVAMRRCLSPHEVDLLLLRYGMMDDRALPAGWKSGPMTIAELSRLVGLKPDKVRRIIINSQRQLQYLLTEWEDFERELV